jgi:subtilase family serine protease
MRREHALRRVCVEKMGVVMRKTVVIAYVSSIAVAAALASQASAQTAQPPDGGQVRMIPSNAVIIPPSSLSKPEDRGVRAHTNLRLIPPSALTPQNSQVQQSEPSPQIGPPFPGYGYETPGSLACLYGLVAATAGCNPNNAKTVPSTLGGKAIALVEAYDFTTALADLKNYSAQFGLPAPNLTVKYATPGSSSGGCNGSKPDNAADYGWDFEEALDIEMAHAMAPKAKIYLVEAQSNLDSDLLSAAQCANSLVTAAGGGEVSMSWGGDEYSGETSYDATYFSTKGVVYFASSGDGPGVIWPSTSSSVVSAGGTSISRALPSFNFQYYATWGDAGGGPSAYYSLPPYQSGVPGVTGSHRLTPDIAADANPYTGVWVYISSEGGWWISGGTSVASPLLAGIANAMGHFRANTAAELTAIYNAKIASATAHFAIPTTGYCGPYATYSVSANWNACFGVGAPKGGPTPTPLTQAQQ